MLPAKLAAPLALAGGVLWILHAVLGGGDDPVAAVLHFVGLACILAAAGLFGSGLVKSDAVGMRVVVGLASALLALSLIEAFRPRDSAWYDGAWGWSPRCSAASRSCAGAARVARPRARTRADADAVPGNPRT